MKPLDDHNDFERIGDYIDGELPETEARLVADRLNRDLAWRDEETQLRDLIRRAESLPDAIEPSRDLWQGIERRIGSNRTRRRNNSVRWFQIAAGIAAALVIASGLYAAFQPSDTETGTSPVAQNDRTQDQVPVQFASDSNTNAAEFDLVLAEYKAARDALRQAMTERQGSLPEEARTVVTENLAVIDTAIREIETALADHPDNKELQTMLVAAYEKEVGLLRQVALL